MADDEPSGLSEPIPLADVFATRLVRIERVGPTARLVFAVPQNGDSAYVTVAKLIIPIENLYDVTMSVMEFIHKNAR